MRKRKAPVLLITAISTLLLVVAVANLMSMGIIKPPEAAAQSQAPDTKELDESIKGRMKDKLSSVVGAAKTPQDTKSVATEPTVVKAAPTMPKQKLNDNHVGSQWWGEGEK